MQDRRTARFFLREDDEWGLMYLLLPRDIDIISIYPPAGLVDTTHPAVKAFIIYYHLLFIIIIINHCHD